MKRIFIVQTSNSGATLAAANPVAALKALAGLGFQFNRPGRLSYLAILKNLYNSGPGEIETITKGLSIITLEIQN